MEVDRVIRRIRAYAEHRGWKKSRLASEAGMADTVLRNFDRGDKWNPQLDTLRKIEAIIPAEFRPGNAQACRSKPARRRAP